MLLPHTTLSISINCVPRDVYDFVRDPQNLPQWATAFCRNVYQDGADWMVETPQGPVGFRFVESNDFGVLDHFVAPAPGVQIYVPMRVIANGSGAEVLLTLARPPEASDEAFQQDLRWVNQDLERLKTVLEQRGAPPGPDDIQAHP